MYAGNIRESIYGGITVTWITDRKNLTQTQKIDAAIWRLLDAWNIAPLAKN